MAIAARIIGDAGVRTVLAALHVAAERGSATNLDCRHDASLGQVQVTGVGGAPRLTMAAENIGHLELRPGHVGLASDRSRRLNVGEFEWALNLSDHFDGSSHSAAGVVYVGFVSPTSPRPPPWN